MEQLLKLHFPPSAGMQTAVEPPHGSLWTSTALLQPQHLQTHTHTPQHLQTHTHSKCFNLHPQLEKTRALHALTCDGGGYLSPPAELSALKSPDFLLHPANTTNNCREMLPLAHAALYLRCILRHAAATGRQQLSGEPRRAARIVLFCRKSLPSSARTGSMMAWTGMSDSD